MRTYVRASATAVLLAGAAAVAASAASAAEMHALDVSRENGRYLLHAETQLDADPAAVFRVLTDYEDGRFRRISSVYEASDYLEPEPDGTPLVYTLMKGCVLFFCKSMERVERLETDEPHWIRTTALPDLSDFDYSRSEWRLEALDGGTRIVYTLEIDPAFWVPWLIGPAILERELANGGERALQRIEWLARGVPESGRDDHAGVAETTVSR